jgi:hypothetical protein
MWFIHIGIHPFLKFVQGRFECSELCDEIEAGEIGLFPSAVQLPRCSWLLFLSSSSVTEELQGRLTSTRLRVK